MAVTVKELAEKFHTICRFCLSSKDCLPIFLSDESFNEKLYRSFEVIASKVDENDGLPNNICSTCVTCIEEYLSFEAKCNKSYEVLGTVIPLLDQVGEQDTNVVKIRKITSNTNEIQDVLKQTNNDHETKDDPLTGEYPLCTIICGKEETLTESQACTKINENDAEANYPTDFLDHSESYELHETETMVDNEDSLELEASIPINGNGDSGSEVGEFAESLEHLSQEQKTMFHEAANTNVQDWVWRSGRRIPVVECMFCNKTYRGRNTLRKHLKLHFNIKNYACQYCTRSFSDRSSLRLHEFRHSTVKTFQCKRCERSYYSQAELKQHCILQHEERKFTCTICNARFSSKTILNDHSRVHMPDRPYVCYICGYSFKRSRNLARHLSCHKNGNPNGKVNSWKMQKSVGCQHCPLLFEIPTELLEHMVKEHPQEYDRAQETVQYCPYCNSSFDDFDKCLKHQNKHFVIPINTAGGRIYECGECGRQLRYKSLAQKHLISHSAKESFECPYNGCYKKYKHEALYSRHIRDIHDTIKQCSEESSNEFLD